MTDMPIMRAAFRTTVSGDGKYEMVFRFPSMDAMHAADDEWRAALNQPAAPVEAVAWEYSRQHPAGHTFRLAEVDRWNDERKEGWTETPLYAHPPEPAASTVAQGDDAQQLREKGQGEGFAAAIQWLRDRSAMKPPATLWHAAAILADQLERSRIPATHHKGSSDGQ